MDEFLDKYNFIEFNERHLKYIDGMLENIKNEKYKGRPCPCIGCYRCPFNKDNNIYGSWCGGYENAMIRFGNDNIEEVKQILLQVKIDYEDIAIFWKIKE